MNFFDLKMIEESLLRRDQICWFSDIPAEKRLISDEVKARLRVCAESWDDYVHADYGDSYREFSINRNRCNFEDLYINRRACLADMAFFEMFVGGGKYLERIEEMVRRICAEDVWCVPSHRGIKSRETTNHVIELYATETASVVSFVVHFLGDKLSPTLKNVVAEAVEKFIFTPYTETDLYGWMGVDGHKINNWNPWINSNIILCAAALCEDEEKYRSLVIRALTLTENYIHSLPDDYYTDEGIRYWSLSGACLFDISEILYDITGGAVDITRTDLIYKACDYLTGMYDEYGNPANFGDATIDYYPPCATLVRAGERTGNPLLTDMGRSLYKPSVLRMYHDNFYRQIKDVYTASTITRIDKVNYPETKLLAGINIYTMRKNGYFLVLKGNHNGEYHNHNDVGTFVLYHKGTPLFVDAGVDLYSGYTFSEYRYKLWYMRSDFHNVPTIAGKRQSEGARFSATPLEVDGFHVATDIAGAYEETTPWIRSALIENGSVVITDQFRNTDGTVLNYILRDEPQIRDNKLIFPSGTCAEFEGIRELRLESLDVTGENPPDGIIGDTPNRKENRSYLIPRLMKVQWKKTELFKITAIPDGNRVTLKVYQQSC